MTIQAGAPLKLSGKLLDVGPLNMHYNVSIALSKDATVKCHILEVQSNALTCQPHFGRQQLDQQPKTLTVSQRMYLVI